MRDYSADNGISPGICHQVAREEFIDIGDFIQATDSHTCMGGASNALTYGVGSTEYANLVHNQFAFVKVPESIRFELTGELDPGCTAKDVMLHILWNYARILIHWIGRWNSGGGVEIPIHGRESDAVQYGYRMQCENWYL